MGQENLKLIRTTEEARAKGRNGGLKSGETRRQKKTMKETAKALMEMKVAGEANQRNLELFGIKKGDRNYQTAVVVRLMQRALVEGDTSAIRLLGELTGDLGRPGFGLPYEEGEGLNVVEYPAIIIPDNGRDEIERNAIMPQAGPQTMFMASNADIVIYGGAAGGGKTYALLMEALRHKDVRGFGGVIFRRNYTQITAEGGLWDASKKLFGQVPGATPGKTPKLHWTFNGGAGGKLTFAHLSCDDDLGSWQGTEIAYIGFDELTHFSKRQFLYMLSRNRSTCGIRPYVRATCNPDADSWVADFVSWWVNQDTGYPIPERSGIVRWMVNLNDTITWYDTKEDAIKYALETGMKEEEAEFATKSVCFIASKLSDNKILMEIDPGYLANLKALPLIDMERLLYGNWKIKPAAGLYFKRTQLGEILEVIPADVIQWVRCWDLAATDKDENGDAAYTAGVLIGKRKNGRYIIADVVNKQMSASEVRATVKLTAQMDKAKYKRVRIRIPQDPGQAGKEQKESYIKFLSGYDVTAVAESGSKESRAEPMAAQWQAGNFDIVYAPWNEEYLTQLENFPEGKFKDMVDASANGFAEIELRTQFNVGNLI